MTTAAVDTTAEPRYIVPVLTLRDATGRIDIDANHAYARGAALTWIDRFLVAGTIGDGELLPESDRARLLDVWRECVGRPADWVRWDGG